MMCTMCVSVPGAIQSMQYCIPILIVARCHLNTRRIIMSYGDKIDTAIFILLVCWMTLDRLNIYFRKPGGE